LLLVIFVGGCRRATTTTTPTISSISSPTPSIEASTATSNSPQPYPQPTTTAVAQATTGGYPQPTIPIVAPQTEIPYPQPSVPSGYPNPAISAPTPSPAPLATSTQRPTNTPEASQTQSIPTLTPTATQTEVPPYPGPGENQNQNTETSEAYPEPQITDTPAPYPGPVTSTPRPTQTPFISLTPTVASSGTGTPVPSPTARTGTPGPTPTELPPRAPLSPPPAGSSVTIWLSWGIAETDSLKAIIQSFQRLYPDVTFSLLYVPLDDLFSTYQEAAYLGQGPSLLLGPARWGPELFDGDLITDLNPYVPFDYLTSLNSAALTSAEYHKSLISLPLSQHGMVMFRNTALISTAPITFEELSTLSHEATHGGVVGSYLERGSYFSAANIIGLGGRLIDEDDSPAFNDSFGLEWFSLLSAYDKAGAVTFNTNRDLDMFMRGRAGIIIDGSWNISLLTRALGSERLAIDPWPTYGTGHMSGWVETDSVFLNANTNAKDRFAALAFIGYLLDPNVQERLAEVGHIPSVITAKPRNALIQQAMVAFSSGAPYPITVDESVLNLYWKELDVAIRKVFVSEVSPANALRTANDDLVQILRNLQTIP
jgi:ABC-type glycerol-3-phosphate transport system substrate-binding protein